MHQKMEIDRQRYHTDRCEKESIHSGHFMISDFEADAQDDGDEVAVPVPVQDSYSPQNIILKSSRYPTNLRTGNQSRSQLNIETSLTDLFQCMSLAYRQKLTSPKWNRFKGIKLRWKEKIRLNNVIWRCWHMQFITKKNSLVCQFASPLEVDFHNKPEAVVLEGKYWKRKLNAVTAEYKKWRMFFRNQALGAAKDCQDALAEAIEWKTHSFDNGMMIDEDYMEFMSDTLFSSLSANQPFAFPDTREIARSTNLADFIQPSLVQLQPNLDDFMDTLNPPDLFYSKLPPVPEECTTNGATDEPFKMESSFHVAPTNILPSQISHQSDQLPSTSYSSLKSRDRLNNMSDQQLRSYQYTQQPQQNSQYMYNTYQNQYPQQQQQQQEQYHQIQQHHQHQQSAQQQQPTPQQPQQQQQRAQQPTVAPHQLQPSHPTMQPISLSSSPAQSYQAPNASQSYQMPSATSQTYQQPLPSSGVTSDYSSMEYVDIHQLAYSNQTNNSSETFTGASTEFKVPSSPSSIYNLHHNPRPTLRSNSLPLMNNNSTMLPSTDEPAPMQGAKLKHRVRSRNSSGALSTARKTSVPMQSTSTDANISSALLTQLLTSNAGSTQTSYASSMTTQASSDSSKPSFFGFDTQVPFAYPPSHLPPVKRSRTPDHVLTSYTDQYIYKTTSPPINTKSRSVLLSSQSESSLYNLSNRSSESQRLFNVFGMSNNSSGGPKAPSGRRYSTNENPYPRRDKSQTMPNASRLSSCGEMSKHPYLHSLPHQSTSLGSIAAGVLGSASNSPKYPDSPGTSESLSLSPLNVGSPSRAPVSPPSKPSTSASPYKEHRRVCHTNAEQKRRCNIKNGFDTLHTLIPHLNHSSSSKMSKAAMLQKGADYIRQLRAERNQIEEDMENLRQQVESLNSAISNCQSLLPATGAPISRHRATKMKEMFDDYVRRRTQEDWKFWLLSLICEPLLTSFNTMVSTASVDELCRTTLQWIEQHCSLVHLRPIVPDALRNLCTSTDALTEPSRLPEQARAAVNKRPNKN